MTKISLKHDNYKFFIKKGLPYFTLIFLSLSEFLISCSSPADLPDFDEKAWQQDVRSCQNIRPGLAPVLEKNKSSLIGLNHTDILSLLGKPEGNSLEKSGERVYYYYIQPGDQCKNKNLLSKADKVFIRFDALDRVYKVRFGSEI